VDFADVKTVMQDAGTAVLGIGRGSGEDRAAQAANRAISSPLLETSMEGARGVLLSVAGPGSMSLHEVNEAATAVADHCDADADIIFGAVVDDDLGEELKVTVIAAGFEARRARGLVSGTMTGRGNGRDDGLDIPSFVQG
jgi:cell division protein FtsZ